MLGLQGSTHHHDQQDGVLLQPSVSLFCTVSERNLEILLAVDFMAAWTLTAHQICCKLYCIDQTYHEFGAETIVKEGVCGHILKTSTVHHDIRETYLS